jgi:RNA polymerase sigma factor (sigma-70 family)
LPTDADCIAVAKHCGRHGRLYIFVPFVTLVDLGVSSSPRKNLRKSAKSADYRKLGILPDSADGHLARCHRQAGSLSSESRRGDEGYPPIQMPDVDQCDLTYRSFTLVGSEKDNHTVWSLMNVDVGKEGAGEPRVFVTTRWSMILSAANSKNGAQKGRDALAELCRTYWRPIFLFVCRRGYSTEDAQDLTQDFFVKILERNWLEHADPNRGRFRSLLLTSLQNFLNSAAERTHTRKRGGDVKFVSWDEWMAETPSQLSISAQALDSLPPERLFDLRWATTVVEQALQRLRDECEGKNRLRLFYALSRHLTEEREEVSYANLSASLGVAETAVKKQLHIMRQRYRCLLRDEVARTVENPADVEDEIRYLCAALVAGTE